jgi:hypothetical protein
LAACRDPTSDDVAYASRAAGSEKTEIVPRGRRDVGARSLVLLAVVLGVAVAADAAPFIEEHVHVRRGDTLATVLAARGVGRAEARPWIFAAAGVYDLRRLTPRRGLTLRFERASHRLESVRYEMDDRTLLVLERGVDGVHAARASLPYFTEVKGVAGRIEHGLREDATQSGIPPQVISALAEIFGWELDLDNDLRPGDEFSVLYENTWQAGGARAEPGTVLGAEIVAHGRTTTAVFFEDADGHGAY